MTDARAPLLIPSEIRAREFDAKLLLACLATERGFSSIVGSRVEMHLRIAELPRGIYLAKDVRFSSRRIFEIMRRLGTAIVALDEEALLYYSRDAYLKARVSEPVLRHARQLFAWGPENAAAWRGSPCYLGAPIHETGNPRVDMMRPELRTFHAGEAEEIRRDYGRFILVNTNFGSLNHFFPNLSTVQQPEESDDVKPRGEESFKRDLAAHRHAVFRRFLALVPQLCRAFPERLVVVRPHPAESPEIWRQAGDGMANLRVVHEGGIIPWLLAADAVMHNSCTTGFEAYVVGTPVVAFRPVSSERFDLRLPNELSHQATNEQEAIDALRAAVDGMLRSTDAECLHRRRLIEHYVAATDGRLASERIVDHLDAFEAAMPRALPSWSTRLIGRAAAEWRRRQKMRYAAVPGHKNNLDYTRHRFPPLEVAQVNALINRLQIALSRFPTAHAKPVAPDLFEISAG